MAKKVKKKTRNTQKERKDSSGSHGIASSEAAGDEVSVVEGKNGCSHIDSGIDFEKISEKIGSNQKEKCEDCREGSADRKGRSKHGKKGGSGVGKKKDSNCVWVCMQCGHFSCGGVGLPTTPNTHAMRHSKQFRHPCVVQLQNPNLRWCFPCNSLIPVGKPEQQDGEEKNVLLDVVKLIKGRIPEKASADVEDVWFGSGNVGGGTTFGATESPFSDAKDGYVVRGLGNLGNTCFFNSIMQNLLAMGQLREYFRLLDRSVGPLTMALKKLFGETSFEADLRNGISPRNLFGSICSRAPQFRGYQQQDSHELLRCLLDGLSIEELTARKSEHSSKEDGITSKQGPTFVDAIFGGQLSSTVSCMECKHSSVVYEPYLDLSLPVPTKNSPSKKVLPVSRPRKGKVPLKYEARKGGKLRGKGKTDSSLALVPSAEGSSEVPNSSSLASSSVPKVEENVDSFNDSWLDFVGSDATSDDVDVSQNDDILPNQNSEKENIPHEDDVLQNRSESQSHAISPIIELKQHADSSVGNSSENDLPLLQGSEVLLLPDKEENLTSGEMASKDCEASSSVLGCEQETLDFDGFGDLFNEPEMDSVPKLDDKNSTEFEVTQSGLLAGNSSASDPEEVDDRDAPVSVNSCLAYFTKPELLSKNAWHCEHCSKTLQGQKLYSKDTQSGTIVKEKPNGMQFRSLNDSLNGDSLNSTAESSSLENGYSESNHGSTIERDGDLLQSRYTTQEESPFTKDFNSSNQVTFVDQANGSCSNSDNIASDVSQVDCMVSQSDGTGCESNRTDKENDKCVKVMRDAMKRILINKAPPILTIHLKRFSQDARGRLSKLSGHVNFDEKIDLTPYMVPRRNDEDKPEYHLIGIVEHSGSMRGGHYVAYVRGGHYVAYVRGGKKDKHRWFYASDAYVREVSLAEVFRSEAYILFYERVQDVDSC